MCSLILGTFSAKELNFSFSPVQGSGDTTDGESEGEDANWGPKCCQRNHHVLTLMVSYMHRCIVCRFACLNMTVHVYISIQVIQKMCRDVGMAVPKTT